MSFTKSAEAVPIEVVLAQLAAVDLDGLTIVGCDAWLADAGRALGWLAVMRAKVELAREALVWEQSRTAPSVEPAAQPEPTPQPAARPAPPRARQSSRAKARTAKLQRAIGLLASFGECLGRGELTEDHVLAVDNVRNRAVAREREAELLAAALSCTAEEFASWLCRWDAKVDLGEGFDTTAYHRKKRRLDLFDRTGEMGELRGALAPEHFDAFKRSLQAIDDELRRRPGYDRRASYQQRMADALVEMMHRANTGGSANSEGSLRTAVVVFVDLDDLLNFTGHGTTPDGSPVDIGEVRRLAAREHIIPVVLGADSVPLDIGRAARYATDYQWLALLIRDGGCVLCKAPVGPLDAHHAPEWKKGGRTGITGLCLQCRRCHRRTHTERVTITIDDGKWVRAQLPDGTPLPTFNRLTRHLT